ncbi:MAG: ATP-binding protein [Microcystaceae cyanobacterium]
MSFTSTLYLCPILELLLADIPEPLKPEVRLGLQEALVNAAKHGNELNPEKTVIVQFCATKSEYVWVISDQGIGFVPTCHCSDSLEEQLALAEAESGRGLCMLYQIFDHVHWNGKGTQLTLTKKIP